MDKWTNTKLPRKGWKLSDVIDTGEITTWCDWCNQAIRYVHCLYHPIEKLHNKCGCICAEALTEDYVNPRKREKELRTMARKKQSARRKFLKSFCLLATGNSWTRLYDEYVLIFLKNNSYKIKIGDKWGKKIFKTFEDAAQVAFEWLWKTYEK